MAELLKFGNLAISAEAGLKTDNVTLSGNGSSAEPIGVVPSAFQRYEKCLYQATGDNPWPIVLSEPLSGYDQVMFKMNWHNTDNAINGNTWQTCMVNNIYVLEYDFCNGTNFYCHTFVVDLPTTSTTATCPSGFCIYTPMANTNWFSYSEQTNNLVNEIWGVKYR